MASTLVGGLQPSSDGLEPTSHDLHPVAMASAMASTLAAMARWPPPQ